MRRRWQTCVRRRRGFHWHGVRESEQVHMTSARVCVCVGVCVGVGLVVGVGVGEGVHVVHEHERTMTCFVL